MLLQYKGKKKGGVKGEIIFFFNYSLFVEDSEVEDDFYSFDECDQSGLLNDDNGNLFFHHSLS